ncbi:PAS domain S-box protein [Flavobacterium sp. 83]|uniref:PAS domain S-box protein n=1 Tax=Flavobacterium sp. 83 TaxID=1131812 RepID=UPI0009DE87BB|nr:PAS domain S-box protein [Flavobacterium sp. 83]
METTNKHESNYTRSLIEASLDPFVTISVDGKITDVNEASIKITGVSRENLIGTDFSDYFTEKEKAKQGYQQVFEKSFVADYPLTIKHKNGKLIDVLYNASVYKDDKGIVLGVFAAARDVTAQKLSSKYSLSLIEASLDPLVTINISGKITDMNQATVNITGIERKKLIGSDFFDYFTEPQKAREVYQEVFAKGSVADSPLTLRHKEGKLTDVLFNGSVYKDDRGNVLGVVIVARDIAEQKWATELRTANKELAYQNNEKEKRADELVIANKELAYQNDEKEKRADELVIANKELAYQNDEKEKRADELVIANKELAYQNDEKEKRADELVIANKELAYQNDEKEKRADELVIANKELAYQNDEKEKRADELIIANKELRFQNDEKEKRAAELLIANEELIFQNKEKEKRKIENKELEVFSNSLKLASQYSLSLIEASRDPLFTISPKGKITDTNEASVRVTGILREKLIGSDFFDYFTEPKEARKAYREVFDKGFIADYPLTIKDHRLTDVLLNGSVYKNEEGEVLGVVVVARDITDQKRIEKESIEARLFAELATEIAEEAKLNAENATIIAKDAVKAKQQFLSNMSHEIRTPMNAIIGFTKVVLKTELSAKQKEYLTAIKMSGDALIVLINDILDLAKVDAGKMVFEKTPFKMKASISSMLHLFETKIQEKNLKLIKEYDNKIPAVLVGDPVRLHQIILNLVSNAVKFTNNGTITVGVHMLHEDHEKVILEFAVTDTGIGIPKAKIDSIFENFQQATSGTSRLYGGTGLGLAIVKQLVEPQGGKIRVKSTIDVGTTFSFTLPFQKTNADAQLENEILELDSEIKDIKVLVVEDIALNQLLMKTLLDDFGFDRDIAENGQIAIEKLKAKKYDIILMDLQMPVMNGFEATEYIRNTMNSKIPIIALTADVTTVDLAKCKSVGMNDYIAKPVDERVLYSKIVGILKKPKLEQLSIKLNENIGLKNGSEKKIKCIDLVYLNQRTKSNPILMMEMISLYLKQTPSLINSLKQSLADEDWPLLSSTVHKMIPSFSIMGIHPDFENMAKKIQEYAIAKEQKDDIHDLVRQLEEICLQACNELEEEFNLIKNT